jgi:hypothetical protein
MNVGHDDKAVASFGPPQTKRIRIQLSCTHYRHAKLKCNREKPCAQCVKKGRASLCTFPPPVPRKRPAARMQNRLDHLESLVKGVMTRQPSNNVPNASGTSSNIPPPDLIPQLGEPSEIHETFVNASICTNDTVSDSSGQVVLAPTETTYVGATHWAAMLDDVGLCTFLLS